MKGKTAFATWGTRDLMEKCVIPVRLANIRMLRGVLVASPARPAKLLLLAAPIHLIAYRNAPQATRAPTVGSASYAPRVRSRTRLDLHDVQHARGTALLPRAASRSVHVSATQASPQTMAHARLAPRESTSMYLARPSAPDVRAASIPIKLVLLSVKVVWQGSTHPQTALSAWVALPTPSPRAQATRWSTASATQATPGSMARNARRARQASTRNTRDRHCA